MRIALCVFIAFLHAPALGQPAPMPPRGGGGAMGNIQRIWSPLLDPELLRYEGVRKELGLTKQQDAKVVSVFAEVQKHLDAGEKQPFRGQTKLNAEQTKEAIAYGERLNARNAERRKLTESVLAVLTSAQKKRLKELRIQTGAPRTAAHPELKGLLAITADQERRIIEEDRKRFIEAGRIAKESGYPKSQEWSDRTRPEYIKLVQGILTAEQWKKYTSMWGKPVDRKKLYMNRINIRPPHQ